MARTTADVLFERLAAWGVDTDFGLPDDEIATTFYRDKMTGLSG